MEEKVPDAGSPTSDERLWVLFSHLAYFFFTIFRPLIIWVVKKDDSEFVANQAKKALNFQLSLVLIGVLCGVTLILLPIAILVGIAGIVFSVIAGMKAYEGIDYRYPYSIRMIN